MPYPSIVRPLVSPSRALRVFAVLLVLCGATEAFAQSCVTSVTGTVYSPNGPTLGDPLPNILVFTPLAAFPPPPIPRGVTGGCAAQTALVPSQVMVSSTTAYDGTFTLTNSSLAGTNVPIVIQAGKWRRQYVIPSVPACTTTTFNMNMPASAADGDLPEVAIVTGEEDALECVFRKIGIADSEFTLPGAGGHINLYQGTYPGANQDAAGNTMPGETVLLDTAATLNSYDLTLFPCQGFDTYTPIWKGTQAATEQANLLSYANSGGRIFATDVSQVYLNEPGTWSNEATWFALTGPNTALSDGTATINTSTTRGMILSNWLTYVGATPTPTQLPLQNLKQNETAVASNVNIDATLNMPYGGSPVGTNPIYPQITFDTPVNSGTTPVIQVSFANTPAVFHTGDTADTVTINVSNTSSTTAADPSLNVSLTLPPGLTATALGGGQWNCNLATLVCNRNTGASLAAGATDPITLTTGVSGAAIAGNSNLTVAVAGGGQSGTNECGRVLFNSYHVENPNGKKDQPIPTADQPAPIPSGSEPATKVTAFPFPTECKTVKATGANTLTAQEKFLEYSLYNLSNFISPLFTDVITIQVLPMITWTTPTAIYYGTPLDGTELDATATDPQSGVAVPGTFVYTPPTGTVLDAGTQTLNVSFTPKDATKYSNNTGTVQLTVNPDTTSIALNSSVNPALQNQSITFTATLMGNVAAPTGSVSFYNGATLLGTQTLTVNNANSSSATFQTSTLPLGTNNITAVYAGVTDFAGATSSILPQVVQAPSTTAITGLTTPISYGQNLLSGASIVVTGSSTGGNVTVYVNNTSVCVLPVGPSLPMTCPASSGAGYGVGTYSIYATFSGDGQYTGSTSPTYTVQVNPDNTTTTLASSLNPSFVGNSVTFTSTVTAPYATPTGTVSFYDGTTLLGTGALGSASGNTVTATYSTSALAAGSHNITAVYTATTGFATSTSSIVTQVVKLITPTITWPAPASVPYGTALSITQLNATATDPVTGNSILGTYTYTPASGTVLAAGSQTLNLTFTPKDPTTYSSATATNTLVVTQDTTGTTLASSLNPSLPTQSVTFTATVTGSNAVPTGSVGFYDGSTLIGTGTLTPSTGNSAVATYATPTLAVGSHPIKATYTATTNFGASSSSILTQVVKQSTPIITWPTPSPVPYGTPLSLTQLNATATDTLTGNPINGTFAYTPPSGTVLSSGSNTLNVTFTPTDTTNYSTATGSTTLTVTANNTMASVASSMNPSLPTQSVTFTATITGSNASPTGTVSFYDGATLLGTGTLTAGPGNTSTATYSTAALGSGTHPITVVYTATTNFNGSTSGILNQVVKQTTPVITWPTPASVPYGTPLSLTQLNATATDVTSGATVAGTFVYTPASGTVLNAGSNTLNLTFTPGNTAVYTNATGTTTLFVTQDTTSISLTSSVNPASQGQSVTFTATLTGNGTAPTGTVSFYNGTTLIGTGTLSSVNGTTSVATFMTTTLPLGTDNITAVYPASTNFAGATSTILAESVLGNSSTSITGLVSPIEYGQVIGGSATIAVTGSSSGGTVKVYINGTLVCTLPVAPGMPMTCPPPTGAGYSVGTYTVYAVFSGDALYNGSTSPTYTVQVVPDPTTTTLVSSLNPSIFGTSVTFTATVAAPYAAPTGSVTFYDGSTVLGVVSLGTAATGSLQATAAYSTTALAIGSHPITASYAVTTNFLASTTASALVQVVNPVPPLNGNPGYILTVTPITMNAPIGADTAITIKVDEVNGYAQPITLSCTGLPAESTCLIEQVTLPSGGGTTVLHLTPGAPHDCGVNNKPYFSASNGSKGLIWLSSLVLCVALSRRRKLLRGLLLGLALCLLPVIQGCGSGGCTDFGTKPGTYSFTITATPAQIISNGNANTGVQSQTVTFNAIL